jgi:hypothetical protein
MQNTPFGPTHIAVIFGLLDDMAFCKQIAEDENLRENLRHPAVGSMYCADAD